MPQDCALGFAVDVTHNLIGSRTLYGKVACSALTAIQWDRGRIRSAYREPLFDANPTACNSR
jgi:hypothetical protein